MFGLQDLDYPDSTKVIKRVISTGGKVKGRQSALRVLLMCLAITASDRGSVVMAADDTEIGFVLQVSGTWETVNGKTVESVAAGQKLKAGATVRPAKVEADSVLRVCLFTGATINYRKEETLPRAEKQSLVNRICSAVAGRCRGSVVQAVSRGDEFMADGVVLLKDSKVDFSPLLGELPEGRWVMRIRESELLDAKNKLEKSQEWSVSIDWTAGNSAVAEVAKLKPGVYEVQTINPRTRRPMGPASTVLFCGGEDYDKNLASYAEAVKLTETWERETRENAATPFLRAFLECLTNNDR